MKKRLTKILSVIMAFAIIIPSALALSVSAKADNDCDCGYTPTVFVHGLNTKDIVSGLGTDNKTLLFPPESDTIKNAILQKAVITNLIKFLVTFNMDYLGNALIKAAYDVLKPASCGNDGSVIEGTGIEWDYRTAPLNDVSNHMGENYATFYYDWRADPMETATHLNVYIDRVIEKTGHDKVNIVAFSMGSVITLAYVSQFGYDKLDGVVLSAPGVNGVATCGEPFAEKIEIDSLAVVRFLDDIMGDDVTSTFIKSLVNLLYRTKVLDIVANYLNKFVDKQLDRAYDEVMMDTLGTMPGLWSLVLPEYYDSIIDKHFRGKSEYAAFVAMLDNYHDNVAEKMNIIIDGFISRKINFGIISKYGSQLTPCIEGWDTNGDSVIDTPSSSFGATCSTLRGTLGDNYVQKVKCGHNHLSPDGQIDASTCDYPEYTWFVRDILHSDSCPDYDELVEYILYSDRQATVFDNRSYPQFMLFDEESDSISPMTSENCALRESIADKTFVEVIKDFFVSLQNLIDNSKK